jgi:hypothetical protein
MGICMRTLFSVAAGLALAGCMTQEKVRDAITEVNQAFRIQYEGILAQQGTRIFPARPDATFPAVRAAISRIIGRSA